MRKPVYLDDFFFIGVLLVFLLINYDMPLSSIYSHISEWAVVMYLGPIMFNLFDWIPLYNEKTTEIVVGIIAGIIFVWFYNYMNLTSPMAEVFATTAFGESESLGKFVYDFLIPTVETVFFFVLIPGWVIWKAGSSFDASIFSAAGIIIIIVFALAFTIFHATSKGLENNKELAMTFAFGALSMGLVLHFKAALSAIITHIYVNSYATGLIKSLKAFTVSLSSTWVVIGIIGVIILLNQKNIIKIPGLARS